MAHAAILSTFIEPRCPCCGVPTAVLRSGGACADDLFRGIVCRDCGLETCARCDRHHRQGGHATCPARF